jgi:DNA-binding transcriptional ArsR family regulator
MNKRRRPAAKKRGRSSEVERLKALANPLRMRILEQVAMQPMTVSAVAAALGESRTKLYRHMDLLRQRGFVEVASTRKVSGITERTYRAISGSLVFDRPFPGVRTSESERAVAESLRTMFDQTTADILEAIASGRVDLTDKDKSAGTLVAFRAFAQITEGQVEEFVLRMQALIEELEVMKTGPGEKRVPYGFTFAVHPASEKPPPGDKTMGEGS